MTIGHRKSSIFGASGDEGDGELQKAVGAAQLTPDGSGRHRGDGHGGPRRRVGHAGRVIVLLVALGLVVGTGVAATTTLWPLVTSLTASNDYTGDGTGAVSVVVHDGDTSRTIGAALEQAGVVKTARAFDDAASLNADSTSIQPGTYGLHFKMSVVSVLAVLLNPGNRTGQVTIREGLWTSEIIGVLSAATGRPVSDYTAVLKDSVMLGLPAQARGNAQGYLFPSTYVFAPGEPAAEQLQAMVSKTLDELSQLGVAPGNANRVLTIASMVQAEARARADGPKVARVIDNRLATAMPLQMDSTIHFIAHSRGKADTTGAQRMIASPYNTYRVAGLPPGPIDNPGRWAIQAALNPAPGDWMYFVAVNPATGQTRFSVDLAGQVANEKLLQTWCSAHPGQC